MATITKKIELERDDDPIKYELSVIYQSVSDTVSIEVDGQSMTLPTFWWSMAFNKVKEALMVKGHHF